MKIKSWPFIIGGLAVIAYMFIKSSINKIIISYGSISFGDFNILTIPFTLSLDIQNQNNFPINNGFFSGSLYYQNLFITSFTSGQINIPQMSIQNIKLNGQISTITLGSDIISLFQLKTFNSAFTVKGNFIYENITVPINATINLA